MIQRIQSLYLFLAAAVATLVYIFPIATYNYSGDLKMVFSLISGSAETEMNAFMFLNAWPAILVVGFLVLIVLCLAVIFLYRKRSLQMRLIMVSVFINIALIIGVFLACDRLSSKLNVAGNVNAEASFGLATYMPLVSLLLLILAFRAVKKDEHLIKSVDRIR